MIFTSATPPMEEPLEGEEPTIAITNEALAIRLAIQDLTEAIKQLTARII